MKTNNDIIWCNNAARFNGEPLAFSHWAKCGILHRSDIVKDGKIDENGIYEKLICKAPFIFDIKKLKASTPENWFTDKIESDIHQQCDNVVVRIYPAKRYTLFCYLKNIGRVNLIFGAIMIIS